MTYSAALFEGDPTRSLATAQQAKYRRIARRPRAARPDATCSRSAAAGAASPRSPRDAGYRVTGPVAFGRADRVRARAPGDAQASRTGSTSALQDYRDVRRPLRRHRLDRDVRGGGRALLARLLPHGRATCCEPGGARLIQTITIADDRFERYRAQSTSSSSTSFRAACWRRRARLARGGRGSGAFDDRTRALSARDYARLCSAGLRRSMRELPVIRALGFDERFIRCWRFYLAYCAAGFATATTDVAHYTFVPA